MSRGPENTFIASVHKYIESRQAYAMKNHNEYNGGIADCWYSGKPLAHRALAGNPTRDLWIEWKFITVPVRDTTVVDIMRRPSPKTDPILSELQQEWLRERYNEGRNVWVGIGSTRGGILLQDLAWEHSFTAAHFRRHMMSRKELADLIVSFVQGRA